MRYSVPFELSLILQVDKAYNRRAVLYRYPASDSHYFKHCYDLLSEWFGGDEQKRQEVLHTTYQKRQHKPKPKVTCGCQSKIKW